MPSHCCKDGLIWIDDFGRKSWCLCANNVKKNERTNSFGYMAYAHQASDLLVPALSFERSFVPQFTWAEKDALCTYLEVCIMQISPLLKNSVVSAQSLVCGCGGLKSKLSPEKRVSPDWSPDCEPQNSPSICMQVHSPESVFDCLLKPWPRWMYTANQYRKRRRLPTSCKMIRSDKLQVLASQINSRWYLS